MTIETQHLALPTLAGFTFRTFENDADYADIVRIVAAESDADNLGFYPTAEWVKNMFESQEHIVLNRDILVVQDAATHDIVAYGRVGRLEQLDGTRRYSAHGQVHPAWRRKGIGTALLHWQEARCREIDATLPPNPNTVCDTWAVDTQLGVIALVTGAGYTPFRYGYEMSRPLDDTTPIPDFPLPVGFEIRPATPEHYRAVWDADVEAFRDHNGAIEPGEARYEAWLRDPMFFQPDLWKVAWHIETNQVAGMVQNFINHDENTKMNRKRGYTEGISTRRPFRKLGLARALIVESLRMHRALGMTEAALGVDATNPTGALRVYEDCGFKPVKTDIVYRKPMHSRD
jgi:GNAT superfamily N-acetyltransferase